MTDNECPASQYYKTADALAVSKEGQVHSALLATRDHVPLQLRLMVLASDELSHQARLRTIEFFVYGKQVQLFNDNP